MKDTTPLAMQYYLGEQSNGAKKLTDDAYPRGIGRCFVTRPIQPFADEPWFLDNGVFPAWNRPDENGDTRTAGRSFDAEYAHFESRIPRASELSAENRGPSFMVIPDRPGEGAESLLESLSWIDKYMSEGLAWDNDALLCHTGCADLPLYLAVQDGMVPADLEWGFNEAEDGTVIDPSLGSYTGCVDGIMGEPVLWKISGIFIGGTDEFKLNTLADWREFCDKHGLKLHYGRCTQSRLQEAVDAGCDSGDSSHPLRLGGTRWARFLEVFDKVVGRRVKKLAAPTFTPWPAWVTGEEQEVA